jgi:hypothetical protein
MKIKDIILKVWDFIKYGPIPLYYARSAHNPSIKFWQTLNWCVLAKEDSYWGYQMNWYDGPIHGFGLGRFHFYLFWVRFK